MVNRLAVFFAGAMLAVAFGVAITLTQRRAARAATVTTVRDGDGMIVAYLTPDGVYANDSQEG